MVGLYGWCNATASNLSEAWTHLATGGERTIRTQAKAPPKTLPAPNARR